MGNQEILQNETQEDAGITFGSLWRFIKRAWLRTAICVVCALALAGLVIGGLMLTRSQTESTVARIEFVYPGISTGLAPDGSVFNKDEIRSVNVLQAAIADAGLESKITSADALRAHLSITDVISDEYALLLQQAAAEDTAAAQAAQAALREYKFFPTRFDVRLAPGFDLTAEESKHLLSNILNAYKMYFKETWGTLAFSSSVYDSESDSEREQFLDFIDYYDLYSSQLGTIENAVSRFAQTDASFRSPVTNKTFSDLAAQAAIIRKHYDDFSSVVITGGISKNLEQTKKTLEQEIVRLEQRRNKLLIDKSNLEDQLETMAVRLVIIDTNGNKTEETELPPEYYALQNRLTDVGAQISLNGEQTEILRLRVSLFGSAVASPQEDIDRAQAHLDFISGESKLFVSEVNDTIDTYYDFKYGVESLYVSSPPTILTTFSDVPKLYILLAAGAIGLVAGLIMTQIVIVLKRRKAAAAKTAGNPVKKSDD